MQPARYLASDGPNCLLDWEAGEVARRDRPMSKCADNPWHPGGHSGSQKRTAQAECQAWVPKGKIACWPICLVPIASSPSRSSLCHRVYLDTSLPPSSPRTLETPASGPMAKKPMILQPQKNLPKTANTFYPTTHPGAG